MANPQMPEGLAKKRAFFIDTGLHVKVPVRLNRRAFSTTSHDIGSARIFIRRAADARPSAEL